MRIKVHILRCGMLLLAAIGAAACSRLPSVGDLPLIYRIDIQQGNDVTQEMLSQLRRGMNPKQVRFVMGTPLVHDTFHNDRWDYLYTFDEKGEAPQRRLVSLYFVDDQLDRAEGDVVAALQPLEVDLRQDTTVEVPPAPPRNLFGRIKSIWSDD